MPATRDPQRRESDAAAGGRGRLRSALFAMLSLMLALAFLEGISSCGLFAHDLLARWRWPLPERQHTAYDPELGWVSRPDTVIEDLYGRGRSVTINAQGFRGKQPIAVEVPGGKLRVICSGDSMTFGYGVDDEETWPARLAQGSPGLEVVNMGQGGYGVDQMILWYERDGRKIEHDVHLFALMWNDFSRMRFDSFMGYGKPTLRIEDGAPVAGDVPVPRRSFYLPWLTQNRDTLRSLRSVQLGGWLLGAAPRATLRPVSSLGEVLETSFEALRYVQRRDLEHGSRLVVVWLPLLGDEVADPKLDPLRHRLLKRLRAVGVPTIDLVEGFRALPSERRARLFIDPAEIDYPGAGGHYSGEGNRFVAARLAARARRTPGLAALWTGGR
jgi:hypothetical protein